MEYGLSTSSTISAKKSDERPSGSRMDRKTRNTISSIIAARTTDGVKPTNAA